MSIVKDFNHANTLQTGTDKIVLSSAPVGAILIAVLDTRVFYAKYWSNASFSVRRYSTFLFREIMFHGIFEMFLEIFCRPFADFQKW